MKPFIWIFILVFTSCNSRTNEKSKTQAQNQSIKNIPKKETIIWNTEHVKISGDSSGKYSINYASYKFEPYLNFEDYTTPHIYKGNHAVIKLNSHELARQYKTIITETYYKEGLNFAGHYCFIWWGCGSPCKGSAVVDLKTGDVYEGPTSSLGYEFKKNSRMIIINPPDSSGFFDDCAFCHPEIWIWDEDAKKFHPKEPTYK